MKKSVTLCVHVLPPLYSDDMIFYAPVTLREMSLSSSSSKKISRDAKAEEKKSEVRGSFTQISLRRTLSHIITTHLHSSVICLPVTD